MGWTSMTRAPTTSTTVHATSMPRWPSTWGGKGPGGRAPAASPDGVRGDRRRQDEAHDGGPDGEVQGIEDDLRLRPGRVQERLGRDPARARRPGDPGCPRDHAPAPKQGRDPSSWTRNPP